MKRKGKKEREKKARMYEGYSGGKKKKGVIKKEGR